MTSIWQRAFGAPAAGRYDTRVSPEGFVWLAVLTLTVLAVVSITRRD